METKTIKQNMIKLDINTSNEYEIFFVSCTQNTTHVKLKNLTNNRVKDKSFYLEMTPKSALKYARADRLFEFQEDTNNWRIKKSPRFKEVMLILEDRR